MDTNHKFEQFRKKAEQIERDKRIFEQMKKDSQREEEESRNKILHEFKKRFGSTEDNEKVTLWRANWYNNGKGTSYWPYISRNENLPNWIYGKEVRIFRMPDVSERVVPYVTNGIEDLIHQIGLDFNINYFGPHLSAVKQVKEATGLSGELDIKKLHKIVKNEPWRKPECNGSPHADVYITNQSGEENWGNCFYSEGVMVLFLQGRRQNSLEFIKNISKHEAGHLFGYQEHHDKWNKSKDPNWEYKSVSDCNMLWRASTRHTCNRCADAIYYFWKGIEDKTGKRFFKQRR